MAQSACMMVAQTRSGSRSAVLLGGCEQTRIKRLRKGIGGYGTVESLPATLPRGSERVSKMRNRPVGTCCPDWPYNVGATGFEPATPIQGVWKENIAENASRSRLTAF